MGRISMGKAGEEGYSKYTERNKHGHGGGKTKAVMLAGMCTS